MKTKKGVSIEGLDIRMRPVLIAAERIWIDHVNECVITAGTKFTYDNGKFIHSVESLHPFGLALDLRTRYFEGYGEIEEVAEKLRKELGPEFDVVIEDDHIHVEFDPPKAPVRQISFWSFFGGRL